MAKNSSRRGKPPKQKNRALPEPAEGPDYNRETPKFCLRYIQQEFDLENLDGDGRSAFALKMQKLAQLQWNEVLSAGRHALGSEKIAEGSIKASIPAGFEDETFFAFRYNGMLPMIGVRERDVFRVLWVERAFGDLYDHG